MKAMVAAAALALASACAETGQDRVALPLFVAGTGTTEPALAAGGVPVTIDRADLAFGPLYICAGLQAGTLCDTARLEWLGSVVVDATDPSPVEAGELRGVSGEVRSWMYDLGISSQLTSEGPVVLDAAEELGGFSLILAGRARLGDFELPFEISAAVEQSEETELGVPVVRKGTQDTFEHEVRSGESGLLVRFDPRPWVEDIDFRAFVDDAGCGLDGPALACNGLTEEPCFGDAGVPPPRDCGALGQICVTEVGCTDRVVIEQDSQAFRSVRIALLAGKHPTFRWNFSP